MGRAWHAGEQRQAEATHPPALFFPWLQPEEAYECLTAAAQKYSRALEANPANPQASFRTCFISLLLTIAILKHMN